MVCMLLPTCCSAQLNGSEASQRQLRSWMASDSVISKDYFMRVAFMGSEVIYESFSGSVYMAQRQTDRQTHTQTGANTVRGGVCRIDVENAIVLCRQQDSRQLWTTKIMDMTVFIQCTWNTDVRQKNPRKAVKIIWNELLQKDISGQLDREKKPTKKSVKDSKSRWTHYTEQYRENCNCSATSAERTTTGNWQHNRRNKQKRETMPRMGDDIVSEIHKHWISQSAKDRSTWKDTWKRAVDTCGRCVVPWLKERMKVLTRWSLIIAYGYFVNEWVNGKCTRRSTRGGSAAVD